jgi:hypothetical protein
MLINTCCGYESEISYDLCPDCHEHCDWVDEDELEADRQTENQIEEEQINKHLN